MTLNTPLDKPRLPTPVSSPISISEFREIATTSSGRVILLMRHAERPKIQENDSTFGEDLGLTESGSIQAHQCGTLLAGMDCCSFGASPMRRTRETAKNIASGMGLKDVSIFDAPEIGVSGLWVEDRELLHSYYQKEGSAVCTDRYFRDGYAEGYRTIQEGTALTFDWLTQTDFGARRTFIISHDIFIAALLQGLGVRRFSSQEWLGYLQSAALVEDSDGTWKAFYCVPDKDKFANIFIQ